MKKYLLSFFIFFFPLLGAISQNLVPNPSFEGFSSCPYDQCQINFATGWLPMGFTPDYFNVCNGSDFGVPQNVLGYQNTATGNAYAGIGCDFGAFSYREYIGIQLFTPLLIGVKYYVNIKLSLANGSKLATNKMGALFSKVSYEIVPYDCNFNSITVVPNNNPQIYSNTIITDTLNWSSISGAFIADSTYQYFIIGNFFDDVSTNYLAVNPTGNIEGSYYFIDDIYVGTDSTVAIIENEEDFLKVFPNPTKDAVNISLKSFNESTKIELFDVFGKLLVAKNTNNNHLNIDISSFPNGMYIITILTKEKTFQKKIIKTSKL